MLDKGLLLEHLLNTSPDILVCFDSLLQIREASKTAKEIFEVDHKVQQNTHLLDFFKKHQIEELLLSGLKKLEHVDNIDLPNISFSHNNQEYVICWNISKLPIQKNVENLFLLKGINVAENNKFYGNILKRVVEQEKQNNLDQCETLREISKEVIGFDLHSDQPNKIKQLLVFLRAIVANTPGNVYWKDVNSVYMGGNNNVARACNLSSRSKIAGLSDSLLEEKLHWEPGTAARFRQDDIEVINSKTPKTFEDHFIQGDSKKVVMLTTKTPIFDTSQKVVGILATSLDITELKQQEIALHAAKEKAEAASRSKTEFLENMRHDIRTPLVGIIGFSEIIMREVADPKIKEYAGNLVASSHALLDLLNSVLEAIKVSSGEIPFLKKKFDVKRKLDDVIRLNQSKARQKSLELLFDYDPAIPQYLIGDPTRLHRIILELVTNALNFTDRGHVKLSAKMAKDYDNDAIVKITVEDTGIGIAPEKQQEIYLQFKRLTPSYEGIYQGLGLGLSIVKQFVEEIDGELYVESKINAGSTFTFVVKLKKPLLDGELGSEDLIPLRNFDSYLPTTDSQPLEPLVDSDSTESTHSRILVVEDSPIAAAIIVDMLTDLNCNVDLAKTGKSAVQFAEENKYDLIFMDIGLPDINGYEVTKRIRTLNELNQQHVPIIALTAHEDEENKKNCIAIGMSAVLTKPLEQEKAQDILNSFIPYRREKIRGEAASIMQEDVPVFEPPVIDFPYLEKTYTKSLAADVVRMLLDSFPDELEALDAAYQTKDWPLIQRLVHRLKGGLSYCGARLLMEVCSQLEACIREGRSELYEDWYAQLLDAISKTRSITIEG